MASKKKNDIPMEKEQKEVHEAINKDEVNAEGEGLTLNAHEVSELKSSIEQLNKEKDEAVNLAKRVQADFDNYRRRNATLKKDSYDEGVRDCMRAILPTLDNFDRAFENTEGVSSSYVEGVRLVQKTLLEALSKLGLKEVQTDMGFDANLHHAVMQEQMEGKQTGEILQVLQKGYEANGKILRHSMVTVAQ